LALHLANQSRLPFDTNAEFTRANRRLLGVLSARVGLGGNSFRRLLLSDATTLLAVMVGSVTVPWWIVQQGGVIQLAQYGVCMGLTAVISMPLLSPLGDRFPKSQLIAAALALAALTALSIAGVASTGTYHFWAVLLAGMVEMIALSMVGPATSSITAELVPSQELSAAMSLKKAAQSLGSLLGPALGGGVLAMGSIAAALWLHFALLAFAMLMALRIPSSSVGAHAGYNLRRWRDDLYGGLRTLILVKLERNWTVINVLSWLFIGPAIGMLIPIKIHALGLSGAWLGACEAALSLGMLAGATGGVAMLQRAFSRYTLRVGGAVMQGVTLALVGYLQNPWFLLLALMLCGLSNSVSVLIGMTHRMLARPQAYRGRMSAVAMMATQLSGSIGPAIAGMALAQYDLNAVYIAFGILGGAIAGAIVFVPGFKELISLDHAHVENWYAKQYPHAFDADIPIAPGNIQALGR
jgi:MFS family permease